MVRIHSAGKPYVAQLVEQLSKKDGLLIRRVTATQTTLWMSGSLVQFQYSVKAGLAQLVRARKISPDKNTDSNTKLKTVNFGKNVF